MNRQIDVSDENEEEQQIVESSEFDPLLAPLNSPQQSPPQEQNTEADIPTKRLAWVNSAINRVLVVTFLIYLMHYAPAAISTSYAISRFHATAASVSLMFSGACLVRSISAVLGSCIGQKYGFDKILPAYFMIGILGATLCWWADSFELFVVGTNVLYIVSSQFGVGQISLLCAHESSDTIRRFAARSEAVSGIGRLVIGLGGFMYSWISHSAPFIFSFGCACVALVFSIFGLYGDYTTFIQMFGLPTEEVSSDSPPNPNASAIHLLTWRRLRMWFLVSLLMILGAIQRGIQALYTYFWVYLSLKQINQDVVVSTTQIALGLSVAFLSTLFGIQTNFVGLENSVILVTSFGISSFLFVLLILEWTTSSGWIFSIVLFVVRGWSLPISAAMLIDCCDHDVVAIVNGYYTAANNLGYMFFPMVFAVSGLSFPVLGFYMNAVGTGCAVVVAVAMLAPV